MHIKSKKESPAGVYDVEVLNIVAELVSWLQPQLGTMACEILMDKIDSLKERINDNA